MTNFWLCDCRSDLQKLNFIKTMKIKKNRENILLQKKTSLYGSEKYFFYIYDRRDGYRFLELRNLGKKVEKISECLCGQ